MNSKSNVSKSKSEQISDLKGEGDVPVYIYAMKNSDL